MTKAISGQPSALKVSIDFMAKYGNKDTVQRANAELAAYQDVIAAAREVVIAHKDLSDVIDSLQSRLERLP